MPVIGWELPSPQRRMLLERFPPVYPDVIAHHVTLRIGRGVLPVETSGTIVGMADDGTGVQALVVRIHGTTERPDGSTYHITWSIDRNAGRKPIDSNDVIEGEGFREVEHVHVCLLPRLFG